jgi:hypothetical protein
MMRDVHRSLVTLFGCALLRASAVAQTASEAESGPFTLDTAVARVDSDGDGIPDAWETARGLNPLVADANGNPDGDALTYRWEHYPEPGTFTLASGRSARPLRIENADQPEATLVAPEKFGRAGTAHVVLAVTDAGTPPLTRYERVIVTVEPPR